MLPKDYEPSRPVVIVSILILLTFSIYAIKSCNERNNAFASGVRFTIGLTTEFYLTMSGRSIKYKYQVNGVEYYGTASYAYNSKVPNGRYWVKFSVEKPEISNIYQNEPVNEDIKSVPTDGLENIP